MVLAYQTVHVTNKLLINSLIQKTRLAISSVLCVVENKSQNTWKDWRKRDLKLSYYLCFIQFRRLAWILKSKGMYIM
jgi:hypothetical protein